jgi:hypothetical protein
VAFVAALAVTAGLAGCGGGSSKGGAGQRINVERLRLAVRPLGVGGGPTCPVRFDVARAAKRAHVPGAAGPGAVPGSADSSGPAATGQEATAPDADAEAARADPVHSRLSGLAVANGVFADCTYHVGRSTIVVRTYAAGRGGSIALGLPQISHDAKVGVDQLERYLNALRKAGIGTPVPVGDGRLVGVRLPVDGPGDAALVVSVDAAMTPEQASSLARALADQLS